jgi:hypothetical protein
MVEIKVYDKWTRKEYVEDNYEYLYATLRSLGDLAIKRLHCVIYDENTIEEEFLQHAMNEVERRLNIYDDEVTKKVFKYFYRTIPVIVNNYYIYLQKDRNLNELGKLAGINISRSGKRKVSKI